MTWYEKIIAVHRQVTDKVSHGGRMKSNRYFVWQEDGANDLIANGKHIERAVTGTTDLFTKREFDSWAAELEAALSASKYISCRLESVDFEVETGFWHYQWRWSVT